MSSDRSSPARRLRLRPPSWSGRGNWRTLAAYAPCDRPNTSATATDRFSQADGDARLNLEQSALDLLLRAGYLTPESIAALDIAVMPPPPEALIYGPDGKPMASNTDSPSFDDWYDNTPLRSILTESILNTHASSWSSVSRPQTCSRRGRRCSLATAGAAAVWLGLAACTATSERPSDEPLPTGPVALDVAICGLDPAGLAIATGRELTVVEEDFTGTGPDVRGTCGIKGEDDRRQMVWLTVYDADSEKCVTARDIVEGRSAWPEVVDFTRLDGGAWSRVRSSDDDLGKGTSSVAFVGNACISLGLRVGAMGRAPVPDIEALTQQAIATLGLDPSSA